MVPITMKERGDMLNPSYVEDETGICFLIDSPIPKRNNIHFEWLVHKSAKEKNLRFCNYVKKKKKLHCHS